MSEPQTLRDAFAPLAPLLGEWVTESDSPLGPARCTRRFGPTLGGAYVELVARWEFGNGTTYDERALFGTLASGTLCYWSFTSDGKRSTGEIGDVSDIHPDALGFVAAMPAGTARQAYRVIDDGSLLWIVQAQTPKGWEPLMEQRYRRVET